MVLANKDCFIQSLRFLKLLVAFFDFNTKLVLVILQQGLHVVLYDEKVVLILALGQELLLKNLHRALSITVLDQSIDCALQVAKLG